MRLRALEKVGGRRSGHEGQANSSRRAATDERRRTHANRAAAASRRRAVAHARRPTRRARPQRSRADRTGPDPAARASGPRPARRTPARPRRARRRGRPRRPRSFGRRCGERLLVRLAVDRTEPPHAGRQGAVRRAGHRGARASGLGITLWLSTDAAERSYQLGSARETNQALLQQKEALERDVLEAQAAPALAEAARDLGMIPSRDTAHLVQDPAGNWVVVGTPKPAEGVPPPPLNTPLPDDTPAPPPPPAPRVVDPREVTVRTPAVPAARARRRRPCPVRSRTAPSADRPAAASPRRWPPAARRPARRRTAPAPAAAGRSRDCRCCRPGARQSPRAIAAAPSPSPAAAPVAPGPRRRRAVQPRSPHRCPGRRHEPRRQRAVPRRRDRQAPRRPARRRSARSGPRGPGAPGTPSTETGLRSASFVFRHRGGNAVIFLLLLVAGGAAVQPAGAAGRRAARRGRRPAQGHRRREGGARQHRRPQQRQAGLHHRGPGADVPAGQGPQAARRGEGRSHAGGAGPARRLRDIATEVAARLDNKPDCQDGAQEAAAATSRSSIWPAPSTRPSPTRSPTKFPEVGSERQDLRQYPGGSLAANIVGGIDWDGHGLLGLEDSLDAVLAGTDGSVTYDRGSDGVVIPGSYRNRHDAVNGSTVHADHRRRHPVLRPAAGAAGQGRSPAPRTSPRWCWTPKPVRCWRCRTTTRSTRRQDIGRQERPADGQPVGVLAVRAGLGEQDRHRGVRDRVRADQSRRGAAGARLDRHGRRHGRRRLGARRRCRTPPPASSGSRRTSAR